MSDKGVLTFGYHRGALRFYLDGQEIMAADRHVLRNLLKEIGRAIGEQDS